MRAFQASPGDTWYFPRALKTPPFDQTGFNPHIAALSDHVGVPGYSNEGGRFRIFDTCWGPCTFGEDPTERVIVGLQHFPAMRRTQAIEQLTLPPMYSTIPNSTGFYIWEHLWGYAVFVKLMGQRLGLEADQLVPLVLWALIHDLGKTTGGHQVDWMFQGWGGGETLHELMLPEVLEASGMADWLREHGHDPATLAQATFRGWADCSAPDLGGDRVDYALREMQRYMPDLVLHSMGLDSFAVQDGLLVIRSEVQARVFAEGYLLLSQEHYGDPIHRLLTALYILRTQRVLGHDMSGFRSEWGYFHPLYEMYCCDVDMHFNMLRRDPFGWILHQLMTDIARWERTIGWEQRSERMAAALSKAAGQDSCPPGDWGEPAHHPLLRLQRTADPSGPIRLERGRLVVPLPGFKVRQTDPPYLTRAGEVRRLGQDAAYVARLEAHRRCTTQGYVAVIPVADPQSRAILRAGLAETGTCWSELLQRPPMPPEALREYFWKAGHVAGSYTPIRYAPG